MKKYNINYDGGEITFFLIRKNVKNINLRVKKTGEVIVTANDNVSEEYILNFLNRKINWIVGNVNKFNLRNKEISKEKEILEDNNLKYLGKIYKIKTVKSDKEYVKRGTKNVYVFLKDVNDLKEREKLLKGWYKKEREEVFKKVYNSEFKKFRIYNIPYCELKIRKMKRRWGSCNITKKIITLNSELIKAPLSAIELVVAHEIAHLVYGNHSKDFYNLLEKVMADFREREKLLTKVYIE